MPKIKPNSKSGGIIWLIVILAVILIIIIPTAKFVNEWYQKKLSGPEYCMEDIDKTTFSIASQGVELKITKEEGDKLCFRTKDIDFIERLNKQIQDRKLEEELARIEARENFMSGPLLWIIGMILFAVIIIVIAITSSSRNNHQSWL